MASKFLSKISDSICHIDEVLKSSLQQSSGCIEKSVPHHVPWGLDLSYVTENIICMAAPRLDVKSVATASSSVTNYESDSNIEDEQNSKNDERKTRRSHQSQQKMERNIEIRKPPQSIDDSIFLSKESDVMFNPSAFKSSVEVNSSLDSSKIKLNSSLAVNVSDDRENEQMGENRNNTDTIATTDSVCKGVNIKPEGPLHKRDNSIEIPQPQSPSSSPLTKISSTRNDDWFNTTNNAEFSMLEIPIIEEKGDAEIIVVDCSNEETPHRKNFTSGVKNKTELEQQDTFSFSTSSKSFDSSSQSSKKNCPARLSTFLTRHHHSHYLLFNLSSNLPSSRTKLLLNNQICNLSWTCPGIPDPLSKKKKPSKTSKIECPTTATIPTLSCLLQICYAIHAYTKLHPQNVAVIYCSDGKTRTGIAIAVYLKYINYASSTLQAFRTFCSRRYQDLVTLEQIDELIPPSLKTLFGNFDSLVDCGGCIQREKLILRAVTLQGLPVEDMPRIDIWDSDAGLVYSSHESNEYNAGGNDNNSIESKVSTKIEENNEKQKLSKRKTAYIWGDEEGFYRVNKVINGDFLLLCRFGGEHASDTQDPSKILFRYANNSGFLFSGPCELPKTKVDIMRPYANTIEEEDFLITFLFDQIETVEKNNIYQNNDITVRNNVTDELRMQHELQYGLKTISDTHCVVIDHSSQSFAENISSNCSQSKNNFYSEPLAEFEKKSLTLQSNISQIIEPNCSSIDKEMQEYIGDAYFQSHSLLRDLHLSSLVLQLSNNSIELTKDRIIEGWLGVWWDNIAKATEFSKKNQKLQSLLPPIINDEVLYEKDPLEKKLLVIQNIDKKKQTERNADEQITVKSSILTTDDDLVTKNINQKDSLWSNVDKHEKLLTPVVGIFASNDGIKIIDKNMVSLNHHDPGEIMMRHQMKALQHHKDNSMIKTENLIETERMVEEENRFLNVLDNINFDIDIGEISFEKKRAEMNKFVSLGSGDRSNDNDSEKGCIKKGYDMNAIPLSQYNVCYDPVMIPSQGDVTTSFCNLYKSDVVPNTDATYLHTRWLSRLNELGHATRPSISLHPNTYSQHQQEKTEFNTSRSSIGVYFGSNKKKKVLKEIKRHPILKKVHTAALDFLDPDGTEERAFRIKEDLHTTSAPHKVECDNRYNSTLFDLYNGVMISENDTNESDKSTHNDKVNFDTTELIMEKSKKESSLNMAKHISHTDVKLNDLTDLFRASKSWGETYIDKKKKSTCDVQQKIGPEQSILSGMKDEQKISGTQIGNNISVVIKGKAEQSGQIISKKKGYITIQIPEQAIKDGQLLLNDDNSSQYLFGQTNIITSDEDNASKKEDNRNMKNIALKDDKKYCKYFEMLNKGLLMDQVRNELKKDGEDPDVMDGDHNLPAPILIPLKEEMQFAKYFSMLEKGHSVNEVKKVMKNDNKDSNVLDLNHDIPLKLQQLTLDNRSNGVDGQPSLKEVDKCLKSQLQEGDGIPLKDDLDYVKYFKMLKMGLPIGAVKNALGRDGKDPSIMDLDPEKSLKSQTNKSSKEEEEEEDPGVPLKEDVDYVKYFKMLKMGLPIGAVKNALGRDGKDPSIMDLDPEKSLKSQTNKSSKEEEEEEDPGVPLKEDVDYEKYFKMLKMGLPLGAVKNALGRDGKDPSIMDLDPEKSLLSQRKKKKTVKKIVKAKIEKKLKVRRKKIYWNEMETSSITHDSIWSKIQGMVNMESLKYDTTEFDRLFTETVDPTAKKKKSDSGNASSSESKSKKSVQVIDAKRGMNGGIILARIKMDFDDLAFSVDKLICGKFDGVQLMALREFLPNNDEKAGLQQYIQSASKSEETKKEAMKLLCVCERYMVAMMDVTSVSEKFDCLIFANQFEPDTESILGSINILIKACDDVQTSPRFRKLMGMILMLGNKINTGGSGKEAAGFTIDTLLKLEEAKAFDKKTSFLQYLVKLVKANDEELFNFKNEVLSVEKAKGVILDAISADLKDVKKQLDEMKIVATAEGDFQRGDDGKIINPGGKMTLTELREQKSSVREVDGTKYFNQMEHVVDFIPMEKFAQDAESKMKEVSILAKEMKAKFTATLEYFGEDPKMSSSNFFDTLHKFINAFKKSQDDFEKQEIETLKKKKREDSLKLKQQKKIAAQKLILEANTKTAYVDQIDSSDLKNKKLGKGGNDSDHSTNKKEKLILSHQSKSNKSGAEEDVSLVPQGPKKKITKNDDKKSYNNPDLILGLVSEGLIESIAQKAIKPGAAAANNKTMTNDDIKDSLDSKNNQQSLSELDQHNSKSLSKPGLLIGTDGRGIASLAAQAARNITMKNNSDNNSIDSKNNQQYLSELDQHNRQSFSKPGPLNCVSGKGIASLVAQAARNITMKNGSDNNSIDSKNNQQSLSKLDQHNRKSFLKPGSFTGIGDAGIASLVAQAARNKTMKNDSCNDSIDSKNNPQSLSKIGPYDRQSFSKPGSFTGLGGEGIASLAAQAARNMTMKNDSGNDSIDSKNNPQSLSKTGPHNRQPFSKPGSLNRVSGKGIASLAAQAARKMPKKHDNYEAYHSSDIKVSSVVKFRSHSFSGEGQKEFKNDKIGLPYKNSTETANDVKGISLYKNGAIELTAERRRTIGINNPHKIPLSHRNGETTSSIQQGLVRNVLISTNNDEHPQMTVGKTLITPNKLDYGSYRENDLLINGMELRRTVLNNSVDHESNI